MVDFDAEVKPAKMGKITFRGQTAYVIEGRVDPEAFDDALKAGMHMYSLRGSDDDFGKPVEIAFGVRVNFWGVIITEHPVPLKIKESLILTDEESETIANSVNN